MKVSAKMIKDDLNEIISSLKEEEVQIPSFWQVCEPGVIFMVLLMILQGGVVFILDPVDSADVYFSLFFSGVLGFIFFVGAMSASGNYKSIPVKIRKESVFYKLIKDKVRLYAIVWAVLAMVSALVTVVFKLPPVATSGGAMLSMLMLFFIFSADMSRYNLSALSAAITAWRTNSQQS